MKFKKEIAGEYVAIGTYNGKEATIRATAQERGGFVWNAYLDGVYVDGDGAFPLKDIKQQLGNLDYFFDW